MIIDERDLLDNTLHDQFQLELQILASEHRIIILLHISCVTISFRRSHGCQSVRQRRYSSLNLADLLLLIL